MVNKCNTRKTRIAGPLQGLAHGIDRAHVLQVIHVLEVICRCRLSFGVNRFGVLSKAPTLVSSMLACQSIS
jgi:hypothetical protein